MRRKIAALVASAGLAIAGPTVFSVHDDLLAYPQVEHRAPFLECYKADIGSV
jgi:hypothetical protein